MPNPYDKRKTIYIAMGSPASAYGKTSRIEDFAEAVTARVYPTLPRYSTDGKPNMDRTRSNFIAERFVCSLPRNAC